MAGADFALGLLNRYVGIVKSEDITSLGICVVNKNGGVRSDFGGETNYESRLLVASKHLQQTIQRSLDNWKPPSPDWTLGYDYAFYDCSRSPEGFDFLVWLVIQEMIRQMNGAPAPLKVGIWTGRVPHNFAWLDSVYRPALGFIGAVEDVKALERPGFAGFTNKYVVNMHAAGWQVPIFKPAKTYDLPRGAVTITLREAKHWPHRNSNLPAWLRVAKWLRKRGERVVVVRDTAKADEPLGPVEICPLASRELDARMWLYDNAKCNLFVSNGPYTLASFSDKPFLCFTLPEPPGSKYEPNTPEFWERMMGIKHGEQYPWYTPAQRLVWDKDSYENIVRAYEALPV